MSDSFSFTQKFILDKQHFIECFEQTSQGDYSFNAYFKAVVLIVFGMVVVLFTDINKYTAWFVFALGILEALSVHYQKPWWVTRQMLSRASNSEVTLKVDEEGISTSSFYASTNVLWASVVELNATSAGWVFNDGKQRFYVANKTLSKEATDFIKQKAVQLSTNQESINIEAKE